MHRLRQHQPATLAANPAQHTALHCEPTAGVAAFPLTLRPLTPSGEELDDEVDEDLETALESIKRKIKPGRALPQQTMHQP